MTPNAAMAHIRRLACIGVEAGAAMPDALELLTHVVPSANNVFVPTDESYTCRAIISRHWDASVLEHLFTKRQTDYRQPCDTHEQWWRAAPLDITVDEDCTAYRGLYRTALYHECLKPSGQHHLLEGFVRQARRPLGYLNVFRDASSRPFSHGDARKLRTVLPYLALLMTDSAAPDLEYAPSNASAVIIVDSRGAIQNISHGGWDVLRVALNPQPDVYADIRGAFTALAKRLLRQLRASMSSTSSRDCAPPIFDVHNGRGQFTFRAHWLMADESRTAAHACILLSHAEPLPLRLMRGLSRLPLSPAQKSVALLIVRDRSRKAICA
jgi:hypothetical protein